MKPSLAAMLLAAATTTAAFSAPVRFDWFEYPGRDDLFAAPLPAGH